MHRLHTREGKHSELWHNIFVCGVLIRFRHHFDLEHALFLCIDSVTRISAFWRCFTVGMKHAGDSDHPRELSCIPAGSRESRGLG